MCRAWLPIALSVVASTCAGAETLRSLAERDNLKIGVMALDPTWNTPQQKELVSREFNAVTVGTYWKRTHAARQTFDWSLTDAVVDWADGAGLGVHLHPLLYPADAHTPQWVQDSDPSEARAILEEHIRTAVERYRGVVDVWDVVNEAVAPTPTGGYRDTWWLRAMGPAYIVEAFRLARQYDPNAILLYNDYGVERSTAQHTARWNTVKEILSTLAAENLVDGFGWQLHTTPDQVLGADLVLAERMQWVEDQGLKNFVTELDMPIGPGDDQLEQQGDAYRRVAEIWLQHNNGGWLQTWGVYDKYSWLGDGKRPLLLDENYSPKPAYDGVFDALEQATSADFDRDDDVDGADLLQWQRGFGDVYDDADFERWQFQFGYGESAAEQPPAHAASEPSSAAIWAPLAMVASLAAGRRWRRGAVDRGTSIRSKPKRAGRESFLGQSMHHFSTYDRQLDPGGADFLGRRSDNVLIQHNQVGQHSGFERSEGRLIERRVSRAAGISAERFFDGDFLTRRPAAGVLAVERAPRDGGVDAFQRRRRRHKPVAPKRQCGANVQQRAECIGRLTTAGPDDPLRPTAVVDAVVRLHTRDDAKSGKPRNVGGVDMLRVLDAETPIPRPVLASHALEDIELQSYGPIADGVHGDLQAGAIGPLGPRLQILDRIDQKPAIPRRIAERRQERGRVRTERAVDEPFESADLEPVVAAALSLHLVGQPLPLRQWRAGVDASLEQAATTRHTEYLEVVPRPHRGDRGHAAGGEVVSGRDDRGQALRKRRARFGPPDDRQRVVLEHARRAARGVAHDLPAGNVGDVVVNARGAERRRVGQGHVAVEAGNPDGIVGRDRVDPSRLGSSPPHSVWSQSPPVIHSPGFSFLANSPMRRTNSSRLSASRN